MLHITFSKYDCIIVHKAYYLFTCTCVSINSFHSHSHIFYQLMTFLTDNKLFCIEQFGFSPSHSTELAALRWGDHLQQHKTPLFRGLPVLRRGTTGGDGRITVTYCFRLGDSPDGGAGGSSFLFCQLNGIDRLLPMISLSSVH